MGHARSGTDGGGIEEGLRKVEETPSAAGVTTELGPSVNSRRLMFGKADQRPKARLSN